jgi:hypothetical protein
VAGAKILISPDSVARRPRRESEVVGEVCFGGRGREGERWSEDGEMEDEGDNLG